MAAARRARRRIGPAVAAGGLGRKLVATAPDEELTPYPNENGFATAPAASTGDRRNRAIACPGTINSRSSRRRLTAADRQPGDHATWRRSRPGRSAGGRDPARCSSADACRSDGVKLAFFHTVALLRKRRASARHVSLPLRHRCIVVSEVAQPRVPVVSARDVGRGRTRRLASPAPLDLATRRSCAERGRSLNTRGSGRSARAPSPRRSRVRRRSEASPRADASAGPSRRTSRLRARSTIARGASRG